jgi:preprotein translocase subunit SecE
VSQSAISHNEERDPSKDALEGRGIFARPVRFVRQVVTEVKRVVTPTRDEWRSYTRVVTVFILIVVSLVMIFDFAFKTLVEKVLD